MSHGLGRASLRGGQQIGVYPAPPALAGTRTSRSSPAAAPNSILAFKKAVEAITPQVLEGTGVEPIVLRIGTIWGPLGLPDSPFFAIPRLISATVRGEAPDLTPPRPPGFAGDGGDRCYVKDCGRAIALLMRAGTLEHRHLQHLFRAAGRQPRIRRPPSTPRYPAPGRPFPRPYPRRASDDPYLDISRLARDTGFQPAFDVRAGVADYVAWLQNNPA